MKIAAIWWRVSTDEQRETSPETQTREAVAMAQEEGYAVPKENILGTDWHCLSVWDSPPMERLKELIRTQVIQAVFMYEPDRAPSKPAHRLLFRALCEEHGVRVRCRHGQVPDGDMGEVMEFLSAWAKEKQVHRAQQGARDGLRDRARLKGLPPSPRNLYGYVWNAERTRLQTTPQWPNAHFICKAGLEGKPIRRIAIELHKQGVASPSGKEWWPTATVYDILANPVYGGRFYALQWEQVEPQHRRSATYGKTSSRRRPLSEAIWLSQVIVESPPLSWEEWLYLQQRLELNRLQARRHAGRDYLLRSIILCDTHNLRFHGQRRSTGEWRYMCPSLQKLGYGPCPRPYLSGPELEEGIKAICREVLTRPDVIEREIRERVGQVETTLKSLRDSLAALDRRENRSRNTEANLLMERAAGNASPEAFERCIAQLKAERTWIAEERQRLQGQLDTIQQGGAMLLGLAQVRERLAGRLDNADNEIWRMIFNALGLQVHVTEAGKVEVALAIPAKESPIVFTSSPVSG